MQLPDSPVKKGTVKYSITGMPLWLAQHQRCLVGDGWVLTIFFDSMDGFVLTFFDSMDGFTCVLTYLLACHIVFDAGWLCALRFCAESDLPGSSPLKHFCAIRAQCGLVVKIYVI